LNSDRGSTAGAVERVMREQGWEWTLGCLTLEEWRGFLNAYPKAKELELAFEEMANPQYFNL